MLSGAVVFNPVPYSRIPMMQAYRKIQNHAIPQTVWQQKILPSFIGGRTSLLASCSVWQGSGTLPFGFDKLRVNPGLK